VVIQTLLCSAHQLQNEYNHLYVPDDETQHRKLAAVQQSENDAELNADTGEICADFPVQ